MCWLLHVHEHLLQAKIWLHLCFTSVPIPDVVWQRFSLRGPADIWITDIQDKASSFMCRVIFTVQSAARDTRMEGDDISAVYLHVTSPLKCLVLHPNKITCDLTVVHFQMEEMERKGAYQEGEAPSHCFRYVENIWAEIKTCDFDSRCNILLLFLSRWWFTLQTHIIHVLELPCPAQLVFQI